MCVSLTGAKSFNKGGGWRLLQTGTFITLVVQKGKLFKKNFFFLIWNLICKNLNVSSQLILFKFEVSLLIYHRFKPSWILYMISMDCPFMFLISKNIFFFSSNILKMFTSFTLANVTKSLKCANQSYILIVCERLWTDAGSSAWISSSHLFESRNKDSTFLLSQM